MAKQHGILFRAFRGFILGLLIGLLGPFITGYLSYGTQFGGVVEQMWLNKAIEHLGELRHNCEDPELCDVLDYTIDRYNKIGPFDVAVSRCNWYPLEGEILGMNNPLVPGVTLDINVLMLPLHNGAMILVHEALHDYYPYLGHGHVNPIMTRLEAHHVHRTRNR
jgi:hypothetical protein